MLPSSTTSEDKIVENCIFEMKKSILLNLDGAVTGKKKDGGCVHCSFGTCDLVGHDRRN